MVSFKLVDAYETIIGFLTKFRVKPTYKNMLMTWRH